MDKSNYALKKEAKAQLKSEAMTLLNTVRGLKKLTREKLLDKINSGNNNTIKSAMNSIKALQSAGVPKKGITLEHIKKQKKVNKLIESIEAFDKNIMSKTGHLLEGFKNKTIKQLNYKANGNRFVQVLIKQKMDRDDIIKLGNRMSNLFYDDNITGQMCIATKTPGQWRNGRMVSFGEAPDIYNPDEYGEKDLGDIYNEVAIYFVETGNRPSRKGGLDDKLNNCLWNCLDKYLNSKNPFKEPYDLKKYLKLRIDAPIDIDDIPQIEKALKTFKINVSGDHEYTSALTNTLKTIDLKLVNGHYTVADINVNAKFNKKMLNKNSKRAILLNKFTRSAYDGKKYYKMANKEFYNRYGDYIIIQQDYTSKLTLKEEYDIFVHDADILLKETNGIINLYKTGDTNTTILNLFDRYTKHIPNADHIEQVEANWISESSTGALTFGIPYVGPGYKYDFKSNYPSIMKSSQTFAIKAGEFKLIDDKEFRQSDTYFKYGIYRCVIARSGDYSIDKLFRFNNKNKYTHIDLNDAKLLGLDIKLIEDGAVNFLHYSRDKLLSGNELFGEYVDLLFKLKQSKIPRAKTYLNNLWGLLSQSNKIKTRVDHVKGGVIKNMDNDCKVKGMKPYNDNETIIQTVDNNKQYMRGYARIKPFILARARALIAKTMLPYKDIVYRCMTDGFITSEEPIGIKTGNDLGDLVFEKYVTKLEIKNCRKEIILIQ